MPKVFYRGARSLRSKKPSYWSFTPKMAKEYAKLRGGKVHKAHLTPKIVAVGSEGQVARQLGIYKQWVDTHTKGRTAASLKKANELLYRTAKRKGVDAIVHSNQVVVLNPKIINPIK
jgi:hypothetical protein